MPEKSGQMPLFETPQPPAEDVDAMARRIGDNPLVSNAGIDEVYNRPVSEAAKGQGWGPVKGNPAQHTETETPGNPRLFELPGKDGRNNPYNQPVTPREAQNGMTAEEIDEQNRINQAGATAGLEILRQHSSEPS